jgi:cellulose biosynthesis protein BcsQ
MLEYIGSDSDLSKLMISQPVRSRVAFPKAAMQRLPVTLYKGAEQSAEEIRNVVKELYEREVF